MRQPHYRGSGRHHGLQQRLVRLNNGPWMDATIGLHGEYLLPLWEPEQPMDFTRSLDLDFDFRLAPAGEVDPMGFCPDG